MINLFKSIIRKIRNEDEIERLKEQLNTQQSTFRKKINKLESEVNLLRYNKVYVQNEIKGLRIVKKGANEQKTIIPSEYIMIKDRKTKEVFIYPIKKSKAMNGKANR